MIVVSFLNLEYFLSVAQKRSFSKAAQDLCISQQALSIHIARLESEFGVLLFERSHPLSLTPAGEKLYFRVEKMLCLKVEIEQEMHEYLQQDREVINLGVSYEYARTILPQVLPDVCKRYPQVKINLLEDNPKELDLALTEGHIDLILSTTPFFGNNITVERLYSNDISLVVPDQVLSQVLDRKSVV